MPLKFPVYCVCLCMRDFPFVNAFMTLSAAVFLGSVILFWSCTTPLLGVQSFQEPSSSFPTSGHPGLHTEIFSSDPLKLRLCYIWAVVI